jgi:hypothetical protein
MWFLLFCSLCGCGWFVCHYFLGCGLRCFSVLGFVSFGVGLWGVGFFATTDVGAMLVGCVLEVNAC